MSNDDEIVPKRFRNQIGKIYVSPHERGYVKRQLIVEEYAKALLKQGKMPTIERIAQLIEALDRGYVVNSKTISFDLSRMRENDKIPRYTNGHRIIVRDVGKPRTYNSLREAAKAEGCSKEIARKWLMKPGIPNRRGQLWSYIDPVKERPKANQRKKID